MRTEDYKSDNCSIEWLSDLTPEEGESLVGKTIANIEAGEYSLELIFTDGKHILIEGSRWDGCSLGVTIFD